MRFSLAESGRRVARWSVGLLLVPVGVLTLLLFFATGRPVPLAFASVDQVGLCPADSGSIWGDKEGRPMMSLSPSGRCYITFECLGPDRDRFDWNLDDVGG